MLKTCGPSTCVAFFGRKETEVPRERPSNHRREINYEHGTPHYQAWFSFFSVVRGNVVIAIDVLMYGNAQLI